jgi:hypothetical protein
MRRIVFTRRDVFLSPEMSDVLLTMKGFAKASGRA